MASVAKVAGGSAAVLGGGSAVGYGVKYALEMEPSSTVLATATDFNTAYTSGKLGFIEDNKNVFVDPDNNEKWWNWVNENLLKIDKANQDNEVHEDFKSVIKGYSSTDSDTTSLNQVCKTSFKKDLKTVVNIKYKKSIWKYCSKDRNNLDKHENPPTFYTLDSSKNTSQINETSKLGGVNENKSKLIADIADNEEGWNWIYENKLRVDKNDNAKQGNIDTTFNSINKGYTSGSGSDSLNQVCKTAHSKTKSDLDSNDSSKNKYKKNIELYCTKDLAENSLTIPE